MRNKVTGVGNRKIKRSQIVRGLLSRMDADIVAPDGSLPTVNVEMIGGLRPGGSILLSVPDSRHCYLETNDPNVEYHSGVYTISCIVYTEKIKNPVKYQRKSKNYFFNIELTGQRNRKT